MNPKKLNSTIVPILSFYQLLCLKQFNEAIIYFVFFGKRKLAKSCLQNVGEIDPSPIGLVKIIPGVNFINILRALFSPISFLQSHKAEQQLEKKLQNLPLYEKLAYKMLMKILSLVNVIKVLRSRFSYKILAPKNSKAETKLQIRRNISAL